MDENKRLPNGTTRTGKALLVLEALICFGPAAFWSLFLVMLTPYQLGQLLSFPDEEAISAAFFLASGIGAVAGLVAVASVLAFLLGERKQLLSPRLVAAFSAAGIATLIWWLLDCRRAECSTSWFWFSP